MKIFHSGGSPIPERNLDHPSVMLSYWVNVKKGRPDSRLRNILKYRKKKGKKRANRKS